MTSAATTLTSSVPVAQTTGIRVILVDYTLAPHAGWKAMIDEVVAVFETLIAEGDEMRRIAVFGHSAVGAATAYIEPGSPSENGCCENFDGRIRDELLNGEIFHTLREA